MWSYYDISMTVTTTPSGLTSLTLPFVSLKMKGALGKIGLRKKKSAKDTEGQFPEESKSRDMSRI